MPCPPHCQAACQWLSCLDQWSLSSRTRCGRCLRYFPEQCCSPSKGCVFLWARTGSGQCFTDEGALNTSGTAGRHRGLNNSWRCGHTSSPCSNLYEGLPASKLPLGFRGAVEGHGGTHVICGPVSMPWAAAWHTPSGSRELVTIEEPNVGSHLLCQAPIHRGSHLCCGSSPLLWLWAVPCPAEALFWCQAGSLWCGVEFAK